MVEQGNQAAPKQGMSKGIIITIIVALLVIGGSVAAYVAINNPSSDKHKYFLAEKNSYDFIAETLNDRYSAEVEWLELAEKKPTEANIKLSAEYNDPSGAVSNELGIDPAEIVNNSTLTLTTQSDVANKKMGIDIAADVAGFTVDDIQFYLTEEEMFLGLPFLNELLQLKAEDTGPLLQEVVPEYSSDEEIDFGTFFEATEGYLSEDDKEYFQKEYLEMVYDELTDDDFTSSNEKIDVNGKSTETEKIVFQLSEEKLKETLALVFDKLAKDEKVKEIIKEQFTNQLFGLADESMINSQEIDKFLTDFEQGMLTAKNEVEDLSIPNGLTSTIWVDNKLIVKRDFSIEIGPDENHLTALTIGATQLLTDENISFTYDFGFDNSYEEGALTITGDSITKDDIVTDTIKLIVADVEIAYNSEESLKDGKREFDRVISLEEPSSGGGSLYWSGNSTYEKDRMNTEHEFSVAAAGFDRDIFTLHVGIDGKQIKDVEIPDDNVKDIGSMTINEIETYIQEDAAMQFQQWLMGIMMSAGGELGF